MGIANRLLNENEPANWRENHPKEDENENPLNEDKNKDWFNWHIAVHPFTDMLMLFVDGDLGDGAAATTRLTELFDLSPTEIDQLLEVWANFINVPAGDVTAQRRNVQRLQSILRAMERGIPQRYVPDTQAWLYNKLGVTTADDR